MAHPFHRLLPLFPIFLLSTHSLPIANRTQSVIPAHSVPCCLCISFHFSSLCFSTTALTQSGHSGPLGLWQLPRSSLPLPSPFLIWFPLYLNPVGHSGPICSWQPLFWFSHSPCLLCHHFPTSSPPLGLNGSFRPTAFSNLLSLPCFRLPPSFT